MSAAPDSAVRKEGGQRGWDSVPESQSTSSYCTATSPSAERTGYVDNTWKECRERSDTNERAASRRLADEERVWS